MEVVTLSPIDQVQHRGHVHVCFCFPLPEAVSKTSISLHLQRGLDALVASLPLVKGRIVRRNLREGAEQRKGFLDLAYNASDGGPQTVERHFDKGHLNYQQLKQGGFYLHGEENHWFKPCGTTCPQGCDLSSVLNIQANFIQGGLILCFAFHHTAFDATSCGTLVQLYAGLCSDNLNEELLPEAKTPRLSPLHDLHYEAALHRQGRYVQIEEHDVSPKLAPEAVSSLYRISIDALKALKVTVSASLLHEKHTTWISTLDATAGLIWSCVARARAPLMDEKTTCTLNMAVNARSRVDPSLPEGYLGNCIIGSIVHKPLSAFAERTCVSDLAASIRASYAEIDDHLIRAQFTMISAESDIGLLFSGPPAPPSYLLVTSWAAIPLYADFGSVLGIPENVSIPTGPGQSGLCVLQPRKPEMARALDRARLGDLEFYLGLEREAMQRLQSDEEWKKWVHLVRD
jgi:Transferase family